MSSVASAVASLQKGPTATRPTFRLIQVLRAFAALMVVAHHATILLFQRNHLPSPNWLAGSSGVDLFFVISGFVMTISSAPLRQTKHPARTFLARRLERIAPLYWLVTTAKLLVLLLAPALALNGLGSRWHIVASYLFLPSLSAERLFEPVVVVGWTLNFEMAFYVLFAVALAWRWRPLRLLAPVLILVPCFDFLLPRVPAHWIALVPSDLWFYMSTVLWEFFFGMLLGVGVHRLRRVRWGWGVPLVAFGLWPLLTWNAPGVSYLRGILWGGPALAVVMGTLIMEGRWGHKSPRWALELGDASYSIYLIHTLALPAADLLIRYLPNQWNSHWPAEIIFAVICLTFLSALTGEVTYRLVERPMIRFFKGRRQTAVPVNG